MDLEKRNKKFGFLLRSAPLLQLLNKTFYFISKHSLESHNELCPPKGFGWYSSMEKLSHNRDWYTKLLTKASFVSSISLNVSDLMIFTLLLLTKRLQLV